MTRSRISTTVKHTVTLDSKRYGSQLTITPRGVIDEARHYGMPGIIAAQVGDDIINHGSVTGGAGSHYTQNMAAGNGGVGIDLTASGTILSSGIITGGMGGFAGDSSLGGSGGNSIDPWSHLSPTLIGWPDHLGRSL